MKTLHARVRRWLFHTQDDIRYRLVNAILAVANFIESRATHFYHSEWIDHAAIFFGAVRLDVVRLRTNLPAIYLGVAFRNRWFAIGCDYYYAIYFDSGHCYMRKSDFAQLDFRGWQYDTDPCVESF